MASACDGSPMGAMAKGVIVPSGWYTMVAVRFDENSSTRAMTSTTASQLDTA